MLLSGKKLIDFEDVRDDLLVSTQALIQQSLEHSQGSEQPQLVHMCGIPGAGKTTYAENWLASHGNFNLVQFDAVMEQLDGYRKDKENLGAKEAFLRWELPARAVGYHLLKALVEQRRNILFDHSATSYRHLDLIAAVKNEMYFVEMHYIECMPENALARIQAREKEISRHTPPELVYERVKLLQELLPLYRKMVHHFVEVQ